MRPVPSATTCLIFYLRLSAAAPQPSSPPLNARSTAPSDPACHPPATLHPHCLAAPPHHRPPPGPDRPQAFIAGGVTGARHHHHPKNPNHNSTWGPVATAKRCSGAPAAASHRPLGRRASPLSSPSLPPSFSTSGSNLKHSLNPSLDNTNPRSRTPIATRLGAH
jgi:hypothetical protein